MKYYIMTLFPEMFPGIMDASILGRGSEKGLIGWETFNIRDYTLDKHSKVDDYPYGGGAGMVMQAEPVYRCYQEIRKRILSRTGTLPHSRTLPHSGAEKKRVIYMTPQGRVFDQKMAQEFAKEEELIFLCGHYEGVDERVLEEIVTDHVSVGDYVLTGGELPAMVVMDAVSRLVPGVLGNEGSADTESFSEGLLEYPQYTRPVEVLGRRVPDVLMSGHHENVEKWRREKSLERTRQFRPDLYERWKEKQE